MQHYVRDYRIKYIYCYINIYIRFLENKIYRKYINDYVEQLSLVRRSHRNHRGHRGARPQNLSLRLTIFARKYINIVYFVCLLLQDK